MRTKQYLKFYGINVAVWIILNLVFFIPFGDVVAESLFLKLLYLILLAYIGILTVMAGVALVSKLHQEFWDSDSRGLLRENLWMRKKMNDLKAKKSSLENGLMRKKQESQIYKQEMIGLQEECSEMKRQAETKIKETEEQKQHNKKLVEKLEKLNDFKEKFEITQEYNRRLEEEKQNLNKEIKTLKQKVQEPVQQRKQLEELKAKCDGASKQIKELEQRVQQKNEEAQRNKKLLDDALQVIGGQNEQGKED